ncbi:MAG TPA: pilus assembly protein PilZ [Porticoccaceae bacterium]|nr:pilus assembly protein PilZ [Porticoccaceae bacterium]HCO58653.1 pilus assembly protein PilZ [Porticoccaceae bacterium]
MKNGSGGIRSGILNLALLDVEELYACYMPFLKRGGLFIPTRKEFKLGDDVFVLLELVDETDKIPLAGKIVWVNPVAVSRNRKQGVGIEFTEEVSETLVPKIETLLAGLLSSDRPTNTL